jgi:hypothetical protein
MAIERAPDVEQLLRDTYAAHQRGEPVFPDLISGDPATAAYGSDPAERNEGPAAVREMLRVNVEGREKEPPKATMDTVTAYRSGDTAWAAADITFPHPNGRGDVPFRSTTVLVREAGRWKIVQWTVSVLVPDETLLSSWPFAG